ncbi:hypothetical protein [Halomonas sp. CSM-2]|uniref:hypothetical protein n=1 Tax=Halomonas sp. CSM-2 TaxID=1975722 RepID=UPI000A282B26|nr:hypothetical protein [Halomonas sp. CSM-2]
MNNLPNYLQKLGDLAKPDPVSTDEYIPKDKHVMSRDTDGNIVSVYGDQAWDFSMYPARQRFHIEKFITEITSKDSSIKYDYDFRIILFHFIYNSSARAINTVAELFNILKRHSRLAAKKKLSIKESLKDISILDLIVNDTNLDKQQIARRLLDAKTLFSALHVISKNIDGFYFFPSDRVREYLNRLIKEYPYNSQQTAVIPTRILSRRIKTCFDYIEMFLESSSQFEELFSFRKSCMKRLSSKGMSTKYTKSLLTKEFLDELNKNRYSSIIKNFNVSDFTSLRGTITRVRLPILEIIHAFSGMRIGESVSIAMDGFQIKKVGRHDIPIIRSYTTKMARDSGYFADWVTSPEVELAFEAAKVINRILLSYDYDIDLGQVDEASVPLFLSTDSGKTQSKGNGGLYSYPLQKLSLNSFKDHPINLDPEIIVSKEDIAEILFIDPLANIETLKPGIEVGKPFSFQTHMYRRSLAVYTARSGLVSLPTLKKQLKHISIRTSAFYGNNAAFAKNFILPKSNDQIFDSAVISQRGFIKEFQDELVQGQVDFLYDEVVTADEIIFGGMGTQIQKQKFSGTLPTILTDREKTKRKIKQGRMRYAETPLGGCMAVEVCDRIAFSSITTCIGCGWSVFNSKTVPLLEKTQKEYVARLEYFGTGTPYGKQLERDIKDIQTTLHLREKLISMVDVNEDTL